MEASRVDRDHERTVDAALALAWSGGKDAALALHVLAQRGRTPGCLLTTLVQGEVPHHGTPLEVVEAQARAVGVPLVTVEVPQPFDAEEHSARMRASLPGVREVAFGDLFLAGLRRQREEALERAGVLGAFPVWGTDSRATARRILAAGIRAVIVAVDTASAPADLLGREYDLDVVEQLEGRGADPCGENGEVHTVVVDAPLFAAPLDLVRLGVEHGDRFAHLAVALGGPEDPDHPGVASTPRSRAPA